MIRFLLGLFLGAIAAGIVIALNEGDDSGEIGAASGEDARGDTSGEVRGNYWDGTTAANSDGISARYAIWQNLQ